MRRAVKKEVNLNKLKTGCSPCIREANNMKQKISELKIKEVKTIILSMFKKD